MRKLVCISLTILGLGLARWGFAETSTVEAVRLYPDGARILRTATVDVAAGQSLVEIEVPANQFWRADTLQVSVDAKSGLEVLGVQTRSLDASLSASDTADQIKRLQEEIQTLRQEATTARNLAGSLRGLLDRSTLADVKPSDMLKLFQEAEAGIQDFSTKAQSLDVVINEKSLEVRILQQAQNDRGEGQATRKVEVTIDAKRSAEATFTLTYLTQGARWVPHYETTLQSEGDKPALHIVQQARMTQQTGETWNDVGIVLSTAYAFANTQMPDLDPWFLYAQHFEPKKALASSSMAMRDSMVLAAPAVELSEGGFANFANREAEPMAAPIDQASVSMAGMFAEIVINKPQTLEPGREPTQVRLSSSPLSVALSRRTTPVFDETVYLFAEFTNDTGAALLPGQSTLFHNDRFAGLGYMPALQPGETAEMAFGPDERVTVSRRLLDQSSGDRGLLRGKRRIERDYGITLMSFHDRAVDVQVFDQIPVAEDEDVSIQLLQTTTKPITQEFDGKKGVIQWKAQLSPSKEAEIRFGYELLQPGDRPLPFLR